MRFVWETHHHGRDFAEFQGAEHFFAAGAGRRAVIHFAKNEHHRRLHVLDVGQRRACFKILLVVKRRCFEPSRLKQSKIGCVPPINPTRDVALGHGRGEARGLSHHPVREQSATASAGHAQFVLVDVPAANHFIHPGHQIFVIVAGIMILNDVAKILAVSRAPARIRIKHHVTFRRHPLKLVIENVTVSDVWAAMDVQDQRIFFARVKVRRLLQPRLNRFAVERFVMNFFRLGEI